MLVGRVLHVSPDRASAGAAQAGAWARWIVARVQHGLCAMRGHDLLLQFDPHRLSLRCVDRGWNSPGWTLDKRVSSHARHEHPGVRRDVRLRVHALRVPSSRVSDHSNRHRHAVAWVQPTDTARGTKHQHSHDDSRPLRFADVQIKTAARCSRRRRSSVQCTRTLLPYRAIAPDRLMASAWRHTCDSHESASTSEAV